jgi:hypothetical protein
VRPRELYTDDVGDGPRIYVVFDHPDTGHELVLEVGAVGEVPDYELGVLEPFVGVSDQEAVIVYDHYPSGKVGWVERVDWKQGVEAGGVDYVLVDQSLDDEAAAAAVVAEDRARRGIERVPSRHVWGIPRRDNLPQLKRRLT